MARAGHVEITIIEKHTSRQHRSFEYLVEEFNAYEMKMNFQTYLNTMGHEGWELVTRWNDIAKVGPQCVFKREILCTIGNGTPTLPEEIA